MQKILRVLQRIRILNGGLGDVVEDHVHDADGPDGAVRVLPMKSQVVRVLALLLYILVALNEEAARADRWIIDFIAGGKSHALHKHPDPVAWIVELAPLLPGAIRKVFNQVLV